jgi:UDP-N-acetylglucosamine transferase subunit ALG13
MDEIAPALSEEVVMQIGEDDYKPKNANFFAFCKYELQHEYIEKANIVVSHASDAIMIDIAMHRKKAIFVPRQKKYGEVINDNQTDFTERLERSCKKVKIVYDVAALESLLVGNYEDIPIPQIAADSKLIELLRQAIIGLSTKLC